MEKSYVHIYTGDGKGKTTAAIGLAVRAAGRGLCVKFVQFLKGRDTGELAGLQKLGIEVLRASDETKFFHQLSEAEKTHMRERARAVLDTVDTWLDRADLLIMDEAMAALSLGILTMDEINHIIDSRGGTEVVLTGRNAPGALIAKADVVTDMCAVKHYMDAGIAARGGIEY